MFNSDVIMLMVTFMLGVMSPGPDYLMIIRNSLNNTRSIGLWTAFGLVIGITIHMTYSILGFGVILKQHTTALIAIRYIGAAYLLWIAYQSFRQSFNHKNMETIKASKKEHHVLSPWNAFRMGFLTDITNPNAALFIISLYAGASQVQLSELFLSAIALAVLTFMWYGSVALFLTIPLIQREVNNYKHWIDRVVGTCLAVFAFKLILGY